MRPRNVICITLVVIAAIFSSCKKSNPKPTPKPDDIFLTGSYKDDNTQATAGAIWENGLIVPLARGYAFAQGLAVTAVDGNIYIAGYKYTDGKNSYPVATYWKNNHATVLASDTNAISSANAIF